MGGHAHSSSVSYGGGSAVDAVDEVVDTSEFRTPSRRGTYSRSEMEAFGGGWDSCAWRGQWDSRAEFEEAEWGQRGGVGFGAEDQWREC